jgi:Tol biopolymer transport system component
VTFALANVSASPGGRPLIQTAGDDFSPTLSPDGRWLAHVCNAGGTSEVFVGPFPDVDRARWHLYSGGAVDPVWSRDRREWFFLDVTGSRGASAARAIMSVTVGSGPDLAPGNRA